MITICQICIASLQHFFSYNNKENFKSLITKRLFNHLNVIYNNTQKNNMVNQIASMQPLATNFEIKCFFNTALSKTILQPSVSQTFLVCGPKKHETFFTRTLNSFKIILQTIK